MFKKTYTIWDIQSSQSLVSYHEEKQPFIENNIK